MEQNEGSASIDLRPEESSSGRRRTIGLLADYMNASGSSYESELRDAIDARCRAQGVSLLVVFGRPLADPTPSSASHNAIYDLIGPDVVDGLLIISSCLSGFTGVEGVSQLTRRYGALPMCSIGLEVAGIPSIVADNEPGMEAIMEHVISVHGCRRIAFISGSPGNPEAIIRLAIYKRALERHGLRVDPNFVLHGAFAKETARDAMEELLGRGGEPDAIVAANDAMAAGAMEALRKSGRRIPRDALVTGYDDLPFARLGNPPLTTVRQPLVAMANLALDLLLDQMEGRRAPLRTELPTEIIVRRSCGCNMQRERRSGPSASNPGVRVNEYVAEHAPELRKAMARSLKVGPRDTAGDAERLIDGLLRELEGRTGAFVRVVEDLLEEAGVDDDRGRAIQLALISLRQELSDVSTLELEDVWYEASTLVALANGTGRALHGLTNHENSFRLMRSAELTSMALDLPSLEVALVKVLPRLGIRTVSLSRFASADFDELDSFLCLYRGAVVTPETNRFSATKLFPPGVYPADQRYSALVYPMAYEGQRLGVAVFEYDDKAAAYNTALDQVCVALRNIALHTEVVQKTMLHERSVQERLATAKRIEALSVLAGGVAHDLNNTLSPMLALSDVILAELGLLSGPEDCVEDIRADVETIRTASLQAAQTIKDLLTLGRQGRLAQKTLDLNEVVRTCVEGPLLRFARDEPSAIEVLVRLSPEPVTMVGSDVQLARAISNLVHNALDAVGRRGRVVIETARVHVTDRNAGYEPIEPGEFAVVRVADDGIGIAASELGRVFEPFFSKKRAADRSGTGLGLAIVHGVVKEHRGYVDVVSSVGRGTTFSLYFPFSSEQVRGSRSLPPLRLGHERILLVDDDPLLLRTCRRVLGRLGYKVDTLDSGRRACELFEKAAASGASPYDVVVVDMLLNEDDDGLQVLERIQDWFPSQKGIIASGHAPTERVEIALRRGLSWLAKPYTADALARSIQAAIAT